MKYFSIVFIIAGIILTLVFFSTNRETKNILNTENETIRDIESHQDIEDIVIKYFEAAKNNDIGEIKKLTTKTPISYWVYLENKFRKRKNLPSITEKQIKKISTWSVNFKYERITLETPKTIRSLIKEFGELELTIEEKFCKENECRISTNLVTKRGKYFLRDFVFLLIKDKDSKFRIFARDEDEFNYPL